MNPAPAPTPDLDAMWDSFATKILSPLGYDRMTLFHLKVAFYSGAGATARSALNLMGGPCPHPLPPQVVRGMIHLDRVTDRSLEFLAGIDQEQAQIRRQIIEEN